MAKTTYLLRIYEVLRRTGLSRSALYRLIAAGQFPPPIRLTERTSAWTDQMVQAWIEDKLKEAARSSHPGQCLRTPWSPRCGRWVTARTR